MKYVLFVFLLAIVTILVSPIMLMKWDINGIDNIVRGLAEICGIEEK
jgi:hypothetical protein